jgi:hypothetical protein
MSTLKTKSILREERERDMLWAWPLTDVHWGLSWGSNKLPSKDMCEDQRFLKTEQNGVGRLVRTRTYLLIYMYMCVYIYVYIFP